MQPNYRLNLMQLPMNISCVVTLITERILYQVVVCLLTT